MYTIHDLLLKFLFCFEITSKDKTKLKAQNTNKKKNEIKKTK